MELVKFDVLPANITTRVTRKKLTSKIEEWLAADLNWRILLLLDEADDFLEYNGDPSKKPDSRQLKREFERTTLSAGLMKATDGRFKMVPAGLHNVQRTTKLPHHLVTHLGDAKCMGPLLMNGKRREERALFVDGGMFTVPTGILARRTILTLGQRVAFFLIALPINSRSHSVYGPRKSPWYYH